MNKRKQNLRSITTFAIFLFCNVFSFAQKVPDYTGIWNGKFYDNSSLGNPDETYRFEVQIAQSGKGLEGVTYSYQSTRFYGKAGHNGFIKTDGKKIVVQETRMLEIKMDIGVACLMTCSMTYSKVGDDEYLEGSYTAIEENSGRGCPGGYVKLKKIKKSIFGTDPKVAKKLNEIERNKPKPKATNVVPLPIAKKAPTPSVPLRPKYQPKPPKPVTDIVVNNPIKMPPTVKTNPTAPPKTVEPPIIKKDTPAVVVNPVVPPVIKNPVVVAPIEPKVVTPMPTELQQRKTELVQSISVSDTAELMLNFYDYGEVDGDIVTIYVNNVAVATKAYLSEKPILVPIRLSSKNPVVEVIMYADNLGTVPPNTAYMTVKVNGKRFEATIESTEQKNASIKFVYQPSFDGTKKN